MSEQSQAQSRKKTRARMEGFELLSDADWHLIAQEIPPDQGIAQYVRELINKAVFWYIASKPMQFANDVAASFSAVVRTAEAFQSAYENAYHNERLGSVAEPDVEFFERLGQIIEHAKEAADVAKTFAPQPKRRGDNSDTHLSILINKIIVIGSVVGGIEISSSETNGRGGPMVRFVQNSMRHVLGEKPSASAVRGWIRKFPRGKQSAHH